MNWISYPLNSSSNEFRTLSEINNDIDDELEFHIQSRIEDLRAEGMTHQQAETAARAAFGSQASIRKQCQLINFGMRIWFRRLACAAIAGCLIAIAILGYQLVNERNRSSQLMMQLQLATADYDDVRGTVLDSHDHPIAGANVYITVKTWPNGSFHQEQFVATTDSDGRFDYPKLLPMKKSYAVNVSIFKPGYAFASKYLYKKSERPTRFDPLVFGLQSSNPVKLQIQHTDESPAANLSVVVFGRFDGSEEHVVYDLGDCPLELKTDSNGMLSVPFVKNTDELDLGLPSSDGSGMQLQTVMVSENTTQLIVGQPILENSY